MAAWLRTADGVHRSQGVGRMPTRAKTYLRGRVSAALVVAAVLAPPAQAETVDAGALRAELHAEPFAVSFTDSAGRLVLGGGTLPGGGDRATNVHREGDALVATVG